MRCEWPPHRRAAKNCQEVPPSHEINSRSAKETELIEEILAGFNGGVERGAACSGSGMLMHKIFFDGGLSGNFFCTTDRAQRDPGHRVIFFRNFLAVLLQSFKVTNQRFLGVLDCLRGGLTPSMAARKRRKVGEIPPFFLVESDGE
jgi:hypothetical protein